MNDELRKKIHRALEIKNENLRKQIAHDAHERVMKEYMTDDMELEVFKTIVG